MGISNYIKHEAFGNKFNKATLVKEKNVQISTPKFAIIVLFRIIFHSFYIWIAITITIQRNDYDARTHIKQEIVTFISKHSHS